MPVYTVVSQLPALELNPNGLPAALVVGEIIVILPWPDDEPVMVAPIKIVPPELFVLKSTPLYPSLIPNTASSPSSLLAAPLPIPKFVQPPEPERLASSNQ